MCGKNCPGKETIEAMAAKKATIWKGYNLCAEYFKTEDFTNIMAQDVADRSPGFSCPTGQQKCTKSHICTSSSL